MKRRVLSDEGFPEGGYSGASFSIRHLSVRLFSLVDLKIFQQIRNRLRPNVCGQNHRLRGPRVSLF